MENSNSKIMIYLLVIFFALFVGTGLFLAGQSKKNQAGQPGAATAENAALKQENIVIPTSTPTSGSLSINGEETYPIADNVSITVSANSNGENIVGYDVVLFYDHSAFEFVEAASSLADFTIYPKDYGNYLFLTSVKSVGNQSMTILGTGMSETTIANLTFKPKKIGRYNFSLRQSAEKEKTNLVTDQTEVLTPALADLAVEVIQTLPD